MTIIFYFLLASLACLTHSKLIIYSSGRSPERGPELKDGMTFCPLDHYENGFSILCEADKSVKFAKFYVDGKKVGKDKKYPFFIKGDRNGNVKKWKKWYNYEGIRNIKCVRSDRSVSQVNIVLSCADETNPEDMTSASPDDFEETPQYMEESSEPVMTASPSSSPYVATVSPSASASPSSLPGVVGEYAAGTLVLRAAGGNDGPSVALSDGYEFCDRDVYPYGFSVECIGSAHSKHALFYVNGEEVKYEGVKPYFIAGDNGGIAHSWKIEEFGESFRIGCALSDGISNEVGVKVMCEEQDVELEGDGVTVSEKTGCVVIDARSTLLSKDWVIDGDGVTFRPKLEKTYIAKAGEFALTYLFTAPTKSRYAFVLDMTTRDRTEHNDVWVKFTEGGFQLMKDGVVHKDRSKGMGFIKAYHNVNGRASVASSIDFNPHSISTWDELEAGTEYEVALSGRSSKLTVHNIMLFPCDGVECERSSTHWKSKLGQCKAVIRRTLT